MASVDVTKGTLDDVVGLDVPSVIESVNDRVAVKTGRERVPFVEFAEDDSDGKWHWCLWAGNGVALCQNSVPYNSRPDCAEGAARAAMCFAKWFASYRGLNDEADVSGLPTSVAVQAVSSEAEDKDRVDSDS